MKLYHCRDSRSLRPLWTLEELQLDYELITMEFPPRYNHNGYLEINPLGTVPTFIDGALTMTESSAICQYLVDNYGLSDIGLTAKHPEYGDYLNWIHRSDTTFTFPQALILRYDRYEKPERKQPQVVTDYKQWFNSRLRSIESKLKNSDYLCAGKFTIADICVGYALFLAQEINNDEYFGPHTRAYLKRLTARDAFKSAMEKQKHLASIF
ncbi:MAG: glutathione S-transferase family protein [Colwellia sp.]|nr:glutathione S-transferase family protein [Colwellia sp.]